MFDNYPDVVTVKEMQTMLRIGRKAAYDLVHNGTIPSVRIGTSYLITKRVLKIFFLPVVDILRCCAKMTVQQQADYRKEII